MLFATLGTQKDFTKHGTSFEFSWPSIQAEEWNPQGIWTDTHNQMHANHE